MPAARTPFTGADRLLLAQYLAKLPEHHRSRPSVFKAFAAKHPHHSWESWMEHYKRTGREEIDWHIDRIKREKKAERDAVIAAAARIASSSTDKGKKRARELSSEEEEEESEEEEEESASSSDDARSKSHSRNTKTPFDEKDHRALVKRLARAREKGESKSSVYDSLARDIPEHGPTSWQTYYRNHKSAIDDEVDERVARNKRERKEADYQARRASTSASTSTSKAKAKSKALRPSSSSTAEPPRRASTAIPKGKNKVIELHSSSPEVSKPRAKKAKLADDRQPSAGPSTARKSINNSAVAGKDEASEADDDSDAREHKRVPNPVFTEEDDHLLVHCLAMVECKDRSRDYVWEYLIEKGPQHSTEEWKAYFNSNKAMLFPRIGLKVAEISQNQARKRERQELEQKEKQEEEVVALEPETARKEVRAAKEDKGKGKADGRSEKVVKEVEPVADAGEQRKVEAGDKAAPAQPDGSNAAPLVSPTAQNPSPPTPKATPPSSHSQPRNSQPIEVTITTSRVEVEVQQQQQPAAPAAEAVPASSHSTDPDPSTQSSSLENKVIPAVAPIVTAPVDDQTKEGQLEALAPADMRRQRSLPSPFIKADKYPPLPPPQPAPAPAPITADAQPHLNGSAPIVENQDEDDDSHSLADSDDRRMDELLQSDAVNPQAEIVEPVQAVVEAVVAVVSEWLPLPPDQQALVESVYEMEEQLREKEERDRIALEEEEQRRIAAEKAAVEEERQRVAKKEKAAAAEESRKAREKEEKRLKALEEKMVREAEERARAAEAEQRRVEAEKEEEERRQREAQKEKEELARRRAEQAAQRKRDQEAIDAAAANAEAEADARKRAAIKEGKKRAVSPEAPAPPVPKKSTRGSSVVPTQLPTATPARPIVAPDAPASTTRKRTRDSAGVDDYPPPSGKKPRASLTASARKPTASASPAPAPAPVGIKTETTLTLKEELAARRSVYSLPKRGPHALYLAVSCPTDFTILDRVCKWFSPTLRPAQGTAEYAELEKWVAKEVWSYDDDVIVLAGTGGAKEAIEKKKGRKAVNARRAVLCSAGIEMVSQLKKGWPWASK